jgi:hypothetical protein
MKNKVFKKVLESLVEHCVKFTLENGLTRKDGLVLMANHMLEAYRICPGLTEEEKIQGKIAWSKTKEYFKTGLIVNSN